MPETGAQKSENRCFFRDFSGFSVLWAKIGKKATFRPIFYHLKQPPLAAILSHPSGGYAPKRAILGAVFSVNYWGSAALTLPSFCPLKVKLSDPKSVRFSKNRFPSPFLDLKKSSSLTQKTDVWGLQFSVTTLLLHSWFFSWHKKRWSGAISNPGPENPPQCHHPPREKNGGWIFNSQPLRFFWQLRFLEAGFLTSAVSPIGIRLSH